jgi:hypothetical protein
MYRFKVVVTIICLGLAIAGSAPAVQADDWNKKTVVTFSQPIEIPGDIILPAGTYVFKLLDSASDRHIVQIFNEDQTHLYATILAIPNWRLQVTGKTVMTFGESPVGVPQPIRSWFYPGANSGEEFVYPKRRAMELAKLTNQPVIAMPVEMETVITRPVRSATDEPVIILREAPLTAIRPTGEEVAVADIVTTQPSQEPLPDARLADDDRSASVDRLPQTAGSLPLVGLLGLLSLGAGVALWFASKRSLQVKSAKIVR